MIVGNIWKATITPSEECCLPKLAKDERRAGKGVVEHAGDAIAGGREHSLAEGEFQHQNGEEELQAEPPDHGAPADGAAVGGEEPREDQHGEQSE